MRVFLACAALACSLTACATTRPVIGTELVGKPLAVQAADGRTSTVILHRDGTSTLVDAGREIRGRWSVQGPSICFDYPAVPRECWNYAGPLRRGMTLPFTSDLGRTVRVTM